jgi:hypothetical protein
MRRPDYLSSYLAYIFYGLSIGFAILLRAHYGDDCFVHAKPGIELTLRRIDLGILCFGSLTPIVGIFIDKNKLPAVATFFIAILVLIFIALIGGCE